MKLHFLVLLFSLTAGSFLSAQEIPFQSDRPGQTFSSTTVIRGGLQIQLGIDLTPVKNARDIYQIPTYLRYGITEKLEVNGAVTPVLQDILAPYPSFELGLRYYLVKGADFDLTAQFRYLNTDGFAFGALQSFWLQGNMTYLFKRSSLNSTIGVYRANVEENLFMESSTHLYTTLNYSFSINSVWGLFIEGAAIHFKSDDELRAGQELGIFEGIDWGVSWMAQPSLQLDFATDALLSWSNGEPNTQFFSVGITWLVSKK